MRNRTYKSTTKSERISVDKITKPLIGRFLLTNGKYIFKKD